MDSRASTNERRSRRAARREAATRQVRRRRLLLIGGSLGAAAILALALILVPRLITSSSSGPITVVQPQETIQANGRVLGDPNAPVKVVEWGDYQCPFCGIFAREVQPQLEQQYIASGKVSLEFRDFAFIGPESTLAAQGAAAAAQQGKFWAFHDTLYRNQKPENSGKVTTGYLKQIAGLIGLDEQKFSQSLNSQATTDEVQQMTNDAHAAGVPSTPSFSVNGQRITYSGWDSLKQAIDAQLAGQGQ